MVHVTAIRLLIAGRHAVMIVGGIFFLRGNRRGAKQKQQNHSFHEGVPVNGLIC
jgi:hypothetical protein